MKTETILAILFANGMDNIISKAVAIDNNLDMNEQVKEVLVYVNQDKLAFGKQFDGKNTTGYIKCPVIGYNKYKLEEGFLVQFPNGEVAWKSLPARYDSESKVIDIPVIEPHPMNA